MASADEVLATALKLPREERDRIARELVISLDENDVSLDESDDDVESAWRTEIERRVQEIVDGKVETIDGEEAHEMLRARLRSIRRE